MVKRFQCSMYKYTLSMTGKTLCFYYILYILNYLSKKHTIAFLILNKCFSIMDKLCSAVSHYLPLQNLRILILATITSCMSTVHYCKGYLDSTRQELKVYNLGIYIICTYITRALRHYVVSSFPAPCITYLLLTPIASMIYS